MNQLKEKTSPLGQCMFKLFLSLKEKSTDGISMIVPRSGVTTIIL